MQSISKLILPEIERALETHYHAPVTGQYDGDTDEYVILNKFIPGVEIERGENIPGDITEMLSSAIGATEEFLETLEGEIDTVCQSKGTFLDVNNPEHMRWLANHPVRINPEEL